MTRRLSFVFRYSSIVCFFVLLLMDVSSMKRGRGSSGYRPPPETVRLVEGPQRCSGYLEVMDGQSWASMCHLFLSIKEAAVVCRTLRCGVAPRLRTDGQTSGRANALWSPCFTCGGSERKLQDCLSVPFNATDKPVKECSRIYVDCGEPAEEPKVIFYTTDGYDTENLQVFQGHRFAIACLVDSRQTVRSIRLKSKNDREPPMVVELPENGTANFFFPSVQPVHHGAYQCDYNYDESPELFSKPNTFYINVLGSYWGTW